MGVSVYTPKRVSARCVRALAVLILILSSTSLRAVSLYDGDENKAREKLAAKLLKLSQNPQMKESKYTESKGGGGKETNSNDGNSALANTTYHSYVWDYCENWIGGRSCNKWVDAYVSLHGRGGDRSPLEGLIYNEWEKMKGAVSDKQYKIWEIQRLGQGGSVLDNDNKLDKRYVSDMRLVKPVFDNIKKLGEENASQTIGSTFEGAEASNKSVMANMESLREMAARFTRMFRNRMVSNIGEIWAQQPGIEFAMGEEDYDCDRYRQALQTNMDKSRLEERIDPQPLLAIETRVKTIEERYDLCKKIRKMSVTQTINPVVRGENIEPAGPQNERVDLWRARSNVAVIDRAGLDPRQLPMPKGAQLKPEDVRSNVGDFESGGLVMRERTETNAESLAEYNDQLDAAAQRYKRISGRTANYIPDRSPEILKWKIKPGQMNLIKLNGLTPEMRSELKKTSFPRRQGASTADDPEENLEQQPAKLVVSKQ